VSLVGRREGVDVSRWPERAPVTIAARLYQALRARGSTRLYDWLERVPVPAGPADVLVGHPYPDDRCALNRACLEGKAGVRIALLPLSHRMAEVNAFVDPVPSSTISDQGATGGTPGARASAPALGGQDHAGGHGHRLALPR
jgi:hypothetical protein